MYELIWRLLPGNRAVKSALSLLLAAVAVWVLFQYVFPWAEREFKLGNVVVDETRPGALGSTDTIVIEVAA